MQPESQPPAPAVVVVVVTCDPGPWFEQVLTSLAAQDYPNMSVLVVDSASATDPSDLITEFLPGAFVRRLDGRVGFGRAANQVRQVVEGASHYLFCHDDVVLAPDAVRLLVEEAFRSNSGITTPKYLQWDAPDRLLAVGATADRVGVLQDLVDPGELDQEQHDAVREVFVAPGGATLVRTDLFDALGGFDEIVDQFGEDLDLSWRARVLGARVTAVPAARVLHLQAIRRGQRPGWGTASARRLAARTAESNRIRTVLTCYRWYELLWVLPLALSWMLGEAATRAVQGRPGQAANVFTAFLAGFRQPGRLLSTRRRLQRHRHASDASVRRLQIRGNARLRSFFRHRLEDVREGLPPAPLTRRVVRTGYEDPAEEPVAAPLDGEHPTPPLSADRRLALLVLLALAIVVLIGTRGLFGREIPSVGHIPNTSQGIGGLWRAWWSTWQQSGLGVGAPASPALGLLALLGTVLGGAVGTLQHVVVLGPLLLGPLGAYRAARWWGSRRGRLAATVLYAVCPLPYNALSHGDWGTLVAFAAAPWLVGWLGRLSGDVPFPITPLGRVYGRAAGVALLVAGVGSVAPSFVFVVPLVGAAMLAGSAVAGRPGRGLRVLAISVAATFGAVVLLLPWSGTVLGSGVATSGPDPGAAGRLGLGAALRFQTGPFGHGSLGWALLVAAALPLFIGRGWRLVWAARLWMVALVCVGLAWGGSRGWLPAVPPGVALAPAAAALAGSAALGAAAFELDLPGYRFGWRQLAAGVAVVGMALAAIPLVAASGGGRWRLPSADAASDLAFLPDAAHGDYRVLWVGAPDALPLAGYQLAPGVAYGTTYNGLPGAAALWVSGRQGSAPELAADIRLVEGRLTTKLGHLLAPAGVRYLVIPNSTAPTGSGGFAAPAPAALAQGIEVQTDLQVVDVADPNYSVYLNSAWAPAKAVLPGAALPVAAAGASGQRALQQLNLSGSPAVVTGSGGKIAGGVRPGSTLYFASSRDSGWRLRVGTRSIGSRPAFGWGMSFQVPAVGSSAGATVGSSAGATVGSSAGATVGASLERPASFASRSAQVVELLLWIGVVAFVIFDVRRRRGEEPDPEVVRPEWFTPVSPAADRRNWRPGSDALGAEDMKGDEVWLDV